MFNITVFPLFNNEDPHYDIQLNKMLQFDGNSMKSQLSATKYQKLATNYLKNNLKNCPLLQNNNNNNTF